MPQHRSRILSPSRGTEPSGPNRSALPTPAGRWRRLPASVRREPGRHDDRPLSPSGLGEYAHHMEPGVDDLIGPPVSPAEVDAVDVVGERPEDIDLPEVPRRLHV
jgi:hypothetical protein